MKNSLKTILAASALLAGSSAYGQYIQTETFSFTPNGNVNLVFNQLNVSLASISSIQITVVMEKTGGSLSVDNDSVESGTVTFTHTLDGLLSSTDVNLLDTGFSSNWATTNLQAVSATSSFVDATSGDSTVDFNNTGDVDFFQFNPADVSDTESAFINSAVWAGYLGTGTYTINFAASQLVNASGLGGLQQAFTVSQTSGSVTVEYTIVPEPSTFALLSGACALGFLVLRRRRA